MSFIPFIILGIIAAIIAKLILKRKYGWLVTILLGAAGAALGGFLGNLIFNVPMTEFFSIYSWLLAIGGSIIVLLIFGALTRNRKA
ncbi:MAG: GlsB/YeaQ/YmgE family stress response membrane protein [Pseudolysinimonas sp.]|uniref:GlsB/YeaQ/YmgE family stress response membrane protein n=1 Tax=Pseudolysinimonas sp. TaxID=2680009 RepID=UPI003263698D